MAIQTCGSLWKDIQCWLQLIEHLLRSPKLTLILNVSSNSRKSVREKFLVWKSERIDMTLNVVFLHVLRYCFSMKGSIELKLSENLLNGLLKVFQPFDGLESASFFDVFSLHFLEVQKAIPELNPSYEKSQWYTWKKTKTFGQAS